MNQAVHVGEIGRGVGDDLEVVGGCAGADVAATEYAADAPGGTSGWLGSVAPRGACPDIAALPSAIRSAS